MQNIYIVRRSKKYARSFLAAQIGKILTKQR